MTADSTASKWSVICMASNKSVSKIGRLDRALILLSLALCYRSTSVSSVFMVLYIFLFNYLPFSELILMGLAFDPVDQPLSFSAMTLLVGSPVKSSLK